MDVTRQWATGGTNTMSEAVAIDNLYHNALPVRGKRLTRAELAERLRSGEAVRTTHAVFYIPGIYNSQSAAEAGAA